MDIERQVSKIFWYLKVVYLFLMSTQGRIFATHIPSFIFEIAGTEDQALNIWEARMYLKDKSEIPRKEQHAM